MSTERIYQYAGPIEAVWDALLAVANEKNCAVKKTDTAARQIILYRSKSLFKQWAWNLILGIRLSKSGKDVVVTFRADTMGQLAVFGFRGPAEHQFIEEIGNATATKVGFISASPAATTLM